METPTFVAIARSEDDHLDADGATNIAFAAFPGFVLQGALNQRGSLAQRLVLLFRAGTVAAHQELVVIHHCIERGRNGRTTAVERAHFAKRLALALMQILRAKCAAL